ncbi:MAG TPA: DNA recombination protein RmuC [Arachidicoccus sp.]|nr:DNA recombination protein RmuC [Arachidicoccus sp.]
MDLLTLISGLIIGLLAGWIIVRLLMRENYISRQQFVAVSQELNQVKTDLPLAEERLRQSQSRSAELLAELQSNKQSFNQLQQSFYELQQGLSKAEAGTDALERQVQEHRILMSKKTDQLESMQVKLQEMQSTKSELEAYNKMMNEKLQLQQSEMEKIHQSAKLEFEKMASEILEDRTRKFTEANKLNLDALLKPLGENIDGFKKVIRETHIQETKDRASLETKVKELILQTNKISDEANNLASALKGQNKKQGNWGEMILESILEQSGLVRDREYFLQQSIKDLSGRLLRPDVLIKLPGSRTIIIDSKVSLRAYDRYVAADDPEEQQTALKEHLRSMNNHILELHSKNYDQIEAALDFTMLFVPIEPAYLLGIQQDPELWSNAYSKRILLISPTNLIACLKLMDDLWKREKQSQHAQEIVKKGEQIFEKLVGFTSSLETVGENLSRAQNAYEKAFNQLKSGKGNLIAQATRLKAMGLKSSRQFSTDILSGALEPQDEMDQLEDSENIQEIGGNIPSIGTSIPDPETVE